MENVIESILNNMLSEEYFDYGFADLTGLLKPIFRDFRYGISIMRRLDDLIINGITEGPTLKYFEHYQSVNEELKIKVTGIAALLRSNGINAVGISKVEDNERDDDYNKRLKYKLSHKMVATRSGLGWIGKTDLFVSKKYGPRVRLASVLMDHKVKPKSEPLNDSLCGNCSICVNRCPAKAANGKLWNINISRDEFFDPFKCREFCLKISREKINKVATICGICVYACPYGRKGQVSGKRLPSDNTR